MTTGRRDGRHDIPSDAVLLGTDGHGAIHLFSRNTNTVAIIDTADLVDRIDLGSHSVVAWVRVTAQERGWRDLREAEMFVEILAESEALH